jgi:hypothetical protein
LISWGKEMRINSPIVEMFGEVIFAVAEKGDKLEVEEEVEGELKAVEVSGVFEFVGEIELEEETEKDCVGLW